MTHKNPELRTSSTVPDSQKKSPPVVGKKPVTLAKKPAKFELEDGNKWMVVRLIINCPRGLADRNRRTRRTIGRSSLIRLA
jgi:adenylyl cyclase-associated protein